MQYLICPSKSNRGMKNIQGRQREVREEKLRQSAYYLFISGIFMILYVVCLIFALGFYAIGLQTFYGLSLSYVMHMLIGIAQCKSIPTGTAARVRETEASPGRLGRSSTLRDHVFTVMTRSSHQEAAARGSR